MPRWRLSLHWHLCLWASWQKTGNTQHPAYSPTLRTPPGPYLQPYLLAPTPARPAEQLVEEEEPMHL